MQSLNQKKKRLESLNLPNEINNRPAWKFNYLTPNEVFSRLKGSVKLMG